HAGPESLARFHLEAEALAGLQHPNIVQIFEVGEQNGCPYLALEFIDGPALASKLAGTPLAPRAAAELVQTLARATHGAHPPGIVHRDLKPANVLFTAAGLPKITDFGLAKYVQAPATEKARAEGDPPDTLVRTPKLTQTGAILGTPSYMAPEQASGM